MYSVMQGKFIVIDGTDGSGKWTQTKLLVDRLQKEWRKVQMADFPQYGEKSAGMVEEYLNGKFGSAHEVWPYRASILFACDRYAASFQIKKWLEEWCVVITNRYTTSNMGHQAWLIEDLEEREKYLERLKNLEYTIFDIPEPDHVLFLFLDPEVSRKKALATQRVNLDKSKDITENDAEYMKKWSEGFFYVAEKYDWGMIDCNNGNWDFRPLDDIHNEIWEHVQKSI